MKFLNFKNIFVYLLITLLITEIKGEISFSEFMEIVEGLDTSGGYDTNPKMVAFFKIIPRKKKSERRKLDFMGKILQDFLLNMDVRSQVANIANQHYIAIISADDKDKIDKNLIIDNFKDLIDDVSVLPPSHFRKQKNKEGDL